MSTATGNYTDTAVDLGFPRPLGLLELTRTYNSLSTAAGTLGTSWTHSLATSLQLEASPGSASTPAATVTFTDVDGRVLTFTPNPAGGFNRAPDLDADLVRNADGTFTLTYNSGQVWAFGVAGQAVSRSWEGQSVTFGYDAAGVLQRADHSAGPHLIFSYDGSGRLTQADASDGRTVAYTYAADGALASVTDPAGGTTHYATVDGKFQVTDADGNIIVVNTPAAGAVTHQDFPTGGHADFSYDTTAGTTTVTSQSGAAIRFQAGPDGRMTSYTDPDGNTATFSYDSGGYLAHATSPAGADLAQEHDGQGNLLHSTFGGAVSSYNYDATNRPTSVTDPAAGTVHYAYTGTTQVPSQVTDQNGGTTHVESANGQVTRLTDADGNTTSYGYDSAGNLISVTNPAGEVTRFSYDHAGHRLSQTMPSGAVTHWTYDAAGRVTSTTDPLGAVTGYQYSAAGRLLAITDPTGAVTRHEYDASGQLTTVTDALGQVTRFGYDADGNLTTTTAPNGAVTRTEYDKSGRVIAMTDPAGAVTRHGYDADGNLTTITDPLGNVTHRAYDARGNLTEATSRAGAVTKYAYDATDRPVTITDPAGGLWTTSYDKAGRQIAGTDPLGAVTRKIWTPGGKLVTQIDKLGRKTQFSYSPADQVIAATDPAGGVSQYSYDPDGRQVSVTSPAGLKNVTRYDAAGRVVATVDARGWVTRYEYNARGQRTAVISPSGAVTRYRYDPAGQQTEIIDANGSPTRFGYDPAGHLTEVTDAKGAVTRFEYDAAGRQTARTDALGRITRRAYDAAGNLITVTDPAGQAQHFTYDADQRLIERRADDGSQASFTYDHAGRRTSMTDATGTTHYAYDAAGHLTDVTDADGGVFAAAYDAAGQRTSLTYPDGLQLAYSYDLNGRLTGLHDSRAGDAGYVLDADGRLLTEQLPGRFARRYHYDRGLLSRFAVIHDGHPVAKARFSYDPDGRVATQRERGLLVQYRYDPAGQLTDVFRFRPEPDRNRWRAPDTEYRDRSVARGPSELHLTYDVTGNRASMRWDDVETHYEYDPANQLQHAETRGRRIEFRYDPSGRLTDERAGSLRRSIEYNGFGQPVTITRHQPGRRELARQAFNADGLLTSLSLTSARERGEEESAAALIRYHWSNDTIPQILTQRAEPRLTDAERDRAGRLNADFAYGYGRTFASWEHGAATFHTDAFGSDLRTESTEDWVRADEYDVFGAAEWPDVAPEHPEPGRPEGRAGERERPDGQPGPLRPPELPRFGYRGELMTGSLVYLRARAYDPHLGRFTTPDPLAGSARPVAAISPYAYASNDPVNNTDPLGLFSFGSFVSSVVHTVGHVVHSAVHMVHSATGAITHAAQVVASATAQAFHGVVSTLQHVAQVAMKAAGHVVHTVIDAATHVVHALRDAASRTVGAVTDAARATWHWVQKHNQVFGKIGSVLSNISGGLALAGLLIAPIPGLDALTPVLEGAAALTSLGALASQGIAKAAGDQNVSYGDLFADALGAIPGIGAAGRDAEEAVDATKTLKIVGDDADGSLVRTYRSGDLPSSGSGISLDQARAAAERNGIDMRMFDLRYEAGAKPGDYAFTSQTGTGAIYRTSSGRFMMTLTDTGLASEQDAVNSIAHELNHVREILRNGPGYFIDSEQPALLSGDLAELFFR